MTRAPSNETFWTLTIASAKEAFELYFNPLNHLGRWLRGLPKRLRAERLRQDTERAERLRQAQMLQSVIEQEREAELTSYRMREHERLRALGPGRKRLRALEELRTLKLALEQVRCLVQELKMSPTRALKKVRDLELAWKQEREREWMLIRMLGQTRVQTLQRERAFVREGILHWVLDMMTAVVSFQKLERNPEQTLEKVERLKEVLEQLGMKEAWKRAEELELEPADEQGLDQALEITLEQVQEELVESKEVEPSGIEIRRQHFVSFRKQHQSSENKVLERLQAWAQYEESRKVMEIVMKTWDGEIGAVSRVRKRMLEVHRQVETLGRNDVAAELINRLTGITDYSLDRTVVLRRVKALEQHVRELEPDTVRSVVLVMDVIMNWNEWPYVRRDRAVERE